MIAGGMNWDSKWDASSSTVASKPEDPFEHHPPSRVLVCLVDDARASVSLCCITYRITIHSLSGREVQRFEPVRRGFDRGDLIGWKRQKTDMKTEDIEDNIFPTSRDNVAPKKMMSSTVFANLSVSVASI